MNFHEMEEKYRDLQHRHKTGKLNNDQFNEAVNELRLTDAENRWWQIRAEDGAWLLWNGFAWVENTSPAGSKEITAESAVEAGQVTEKTSGSGPRSLFDLLIIIGKSLLRTLGKKIIISIFLLVLVWFIHTFLMAYYNDGFFLAKSPLLAMILSLERGKPGGVLFWMLFTGLLTALLMSLRREGFGALISKLKQTPAAIKISADRAGQLMPAFFLGGGALALFISFYFAHKGDYIANRLVSLLLACALFLTLSGGTKSFLFLIFRLTWQDLKKLLPKQFTMPYEPHYLIVAMAGLAAGFVLATILPFLPWSGYLALVALIAAAITLSFNRKVSPTALILFSAGSALAITALLSREAHACYGGFHEYGGSLEAWLNRDGGRAGYVMSLGVPPAIGAVIGYLLPQIQADDDLTAWLEEEIPEGPIADQETAPQPLEEEPIPEAIPYERTPQEIFENPRFHDRFTDANGKEWIYYRRPGDTEGDGWTSPEHYEQTTKMEKMGMIWTNRYGWTSRDDLASTEKRDEKLRQDNREASRLFDENIQQEQADLRRQQQADIERRQKIEELRQKQDDLEFQNRLDELDIRFSGKQGLYNTSREIFSGMTKVIDPKTGTYVDSVSYKAMGLRMLTGLVSGGKSEYLFNSVDAGYRVNDKLASGETLTQAISGAAGEMLEEEIYGRLLMRGAKDTAGYLKGGKASATSLAREAEPLTDALKGKKAAIDDVLKIKDPAEKAATIKDLYKDGGIKDLGRLEKTGHISRKQANEINQVMTAEVNEAVNAGTTKTLKDFRVAGKDGIRVEVEGVKVNEVMVGDSGSSAHGSSGRSVITDHDRTTYLSFEKNSLESYAQNNGITTDEAQKRLNKVFSDQQKVNIDNDLGKRGLDAADVDQKIYSGMGKGAGHLDDYPSGFTATRQATQGKTTVFNIEDGQVKNPYTASGEALTDRMALDKAHIGDDSMLQKSPVIGGTPEARLNEARSLAYNQVDSLGKIENAEKAAKALERIDKAAALAEKTRVPGNLMEQAKALRNLPQDTLAAMGKEGQEKFIASVREISSKIIPEILN